MKVAFLPITLLLALITAGPPEFDVATVKAVAPSPPGQPININLGTIRNGKVTLGNVTLNDCLKFAYSIVSDAQISGPDWIRDGDVRFEIVGQASADVPQEQLLLMVRNLLAERLKLVVHQEKKELPFLALVVGKNGHKLAPAKDGGDPPRLGLGLMIHNRMPMSVMAMLLSRFERQTVIDLTELSGPFAINLKWTPEAFRARAPADGGPLTVNGQTVDTSGPSLYTAIQEQLGLRLESRKGPLEVLVVDHAEKVPIDN